MPETRQQLITVINIAIFVIVSNNTNGSCDRTKLNGNRNLKTRHTYNKPNHKHRADQMNKNANKVNGDVSGAFLKKRQKTAKVSFRMFCYSGFLWHVLKNTEFQEINYYQKKYNIRL